VPKGDAVFSVDTHLFRELGDLLVGRDATALFELIKNAYDADASEVTVLGTNLDDIESGKIIVADNGCGMDEETFHKGFLIIASRLKDTGDRRSATFHRQFTGAKGIGRLSAHKLARFLRVESVHGEPSRQSRAGITATIDWDAIEHLPTLEDIVAGREVTIRPEVFENDVSAGTRITLQRLRRGWTPEERNRFVAECRSFQAPEELTKGLVPRLLSSPLLFSQPKFRNTHHDDPGFTLNLEGEFLTGESLWPTIADESDWIIEVDAAPSDNGQAPHIAIGIGPTNRAAHENPSWGRRIFTIPHDRPIVGPFFQSRIFFQLKTKGVSVKLREIRNLSGIRVYVEGFRILPYGEPGNDWLDLDAQVKRQTVLEYGKSFDDIFVKLDGDADWKKLHMPNSSYFGAVFLTQEGATSLDPLINREGFLPTPAFKFMQATMHQAIELFTRVRAAATFPVREARQAAKTDQRTGSTSTEGTSSSNTASQPKDQPESLTATISDLTDRVRNSRDLLIAGDVNGARTILEGVPDSIRTIHDAAERIAAERPIIHVLASVGTQMSAFVHEIRSILGTARAVEESIERLRTIDTKMPEKSRRQLSVIHATIGELRRHLERQAAYLLDVVTPDASRRRSRQKIGERFDSGARFLRTSAERRNIEIMNAIPANLKSLPMFPAELTSVFSNLLSNAIKAAGSGGRIKATGHRTVNGVVIVVENTGTPVDLSNAERWFRPFESSTVDVDSFLGQGMGLGLTITRNMLEPYGATIRFTEPSSGFSAALEIVFPD
jgi:signal transduction histidine kinase